MRIARFVHPGGPAFGVVEGEGLPDGHDLDDATTSLTVAEIEGHPFGDLRFTGQRWAIGDIRLLSPILPSKVVGIGRNYPAHAAEREAVPGAERGDRPGNTRATPRIFLKPSTSVIGPDDAIRLPIDAKQVDHEAELAVVIGARGARDVPRAEALQRVFGYTCSNDVTARDQQREDGDSIRAKGHDSFCPLGPWISTDFLPAAQEIHCAVNDDVRQRGSLAEMTHDVATIVSYVSYIMTLLPGDVLLTGTPAGVGPLTPGDVVRVSVAGLGTLRNPVVAR